MQSAAKAVTKEKLTALNTYMRNERLKINNIIYAPYTLEKKSKINPMRIEEK